MNTSSFFAKGRNRLLGAFGLALVCCAGFAAISFFNCSRFGLTRVPPPVHSFGLDTAIPFVPGWVWIYLLYYPFCFLPLLLPEVRNHPSIYRQTVTAFAIQFGVSFTVFLLWPLRMSHPTLPPGLNGNILGTLYGFDSGFNSFPSLHLANIVFVSFLFLRLRGMRQGSAVLGGALLIAVSTLLVKQHFVSDVLTGALLGWGSFVLAFAKSPSTLVPAPSPSRNP